VPVRFAALGRAESNDFDRSTAFNRDIEILKLTVYFNGKRVFSEARADFLGNFLTGDARGILSVLTVRQPELYFTHKIDNMDDSTVLDRGVYEGVFCVAPSFPDLS
jgi:hypothetical protein